MGGAGCAWQRLLELGLARSLRPEFEQIKLSSHARAVHSIDDVCFNGAS